MPSTTTEPTICELLASWQASAPPDHATNTTVADWFALSVKLLIPITSNPAHPQHTEACELAAENSHDALVLRSCAGTAGA